MFPDGLDADRPTPCQPSNWFAAVMLRTLARLLGFGVLAMVAYVVAGPESTEQAFT